MDINQLLATIAMPLAVAAVSNVTHVPQDQLATLVSSLNQANVPATQFVQVIRYTPVALVDQNGQPFVAYVQQQTTQGVSGDALVNAIADQLRSRYGVAPQFPTLSGDAVPAYVVSDAYIPATTTTLSSDPLAAIGLPLAVAAVADIAGVPQSDLASLVASLNQANVPVTQEIQVIRYVPVALADNNGNFVQFVQQQVTQGVTGPALVPVVTQQLQTYYPAHVDVTAPPANVEEHYVVPQAAVTRVTEVHAHPHGGPPGQIKKQLGLQTGAEVVHGEKHHKDNRPMASSIAVPPPAPPQQVPVFVAPPPQQQPNPGHGHGPDGNGPPGQQKDKGGKGKGHGKD
jgi:hypothetical protein